MFGFAARHVSVGFVTNNAVVVVVISLLVPATRVGGAELSGEPAPTTIRVGSRQPVRTIADAARMAHDGDTVEIEPGDYVGDTAVWTQNNLTIRGVNGRPRLVAGGKSAEGKAIWVIRGGDIVIEDLTFTGARVPARNGAGIRFERGKLTVRRCIFVDNEDGMLVANDPSTVLEIEDSEFGENGAGDGQSHNLYVGMIQRLVVTGSYFHHARVGHLLKTRAKESFILYNRLTDEPGGRASYELEFPIGGLGVVVGNVIEQTETTENPTLVSFGAERYKHWPRNDLYFSHNTVVNDRAQGGVFISVRPGAGHVQLINNIFVGEGVFQIPGVERGDNWNVDRSDFADATRFDFRLRARSRAVGMAKGLGEARGVSLRPTKEYTYPVGRRAFDPVGPLSPGAFQQVIE